MILFLKSLSCKSVVKVNLNLKSKSTELKKARVVTLGHNQMHIHVYFFFLNYLCAPSSSWKNKNKEYSEGVWLSSSEFFKICLVYFYILFSAVKIYTDIWCAATVGLIARRSADRVGRGKAFSLHVSASVGSTNRLL